MTHDRSVAGRLGDALTERGETLAVAESCTGGLLGSTVTGVAGSSEYFVGGIISYTNRTKRRLLAISRESLERHGAVSEPVASAMARHVRDETGAGWAVSTTGYAGPSGGDEAPVGTVYVGIAYAGRGDAGSDASAHSDDTSGDDDSDRVDGPGADPFAVVERSQFDGSRQEVKEQIVERALTAALERIESLP
ncbi:CinA family protein [Halosimplex amylolyticum]|uniref:CinA family protein n=1 Tax=Halosimplex amylolyticum TaxID=3396616 RepID=UPI003F54AE38